MKLLKLLIVKIEKMKNYKVIILSFVIVILSIRNMSGQDKIDLETGFNLNIGFPKPLLDLAPGIHLGINYLKKINNRLGIEAQVNYAYLNYEDVNLGFFSQNGGDLTTFSGMIGSRVYLNNIETKKYPIYTNLMVGYGRIEQNEYNSIGVLENKKDNQIAGSLGIFMVFNRKVTLGLAIEGVGAFVNTTLKVGYNF
ncbi:MAG: hypothetical protein ACI97N_001505 [Cognaticolwellia sp.]